MSAANVESISRQEFLRELESYSAAERRTQMATRICNRSDGSAVEMPVFLNEFWSRRQRIGSPLHRVAYRGAFNAALPRFFIEQLSCPGQSVYDGFMGRGTTVIEAALLGRVPFGNDANPLSKMIVEARLRPQPLALWRFGDEWLDVRPLMDEVPEMVRAIFHPQTLDDLCSMRECLLRSQMDGELDEVHRWNRMLVLTSLTGPRGGYLVGPSIHPNTNMLPTRLCRQEAPSNCPLPRKELIDCLRLRSESLTATLSGWERSVMERVVPQSVLLTGPASSTPCIPTNSISLIVTGPPGLKPYDFYLENWLRCWFVELDPQSVRVSVHRELEDWCAEMTGVFVEFYRVLTPGGYCVIDIGRLRPRKLRWDAAVLDCMLLAGFERVAIVVNTSYYGKALFQRPFLACESVFDDVLVMVKPA